MRIIETSSRPGETRDDDTDSPKERTDGRAGSTIAQRLDDLPVTTLHIAIVVLCTAGLFADVAEIALSGALAAVFLAPPYSLPRGDLAFLLASAYAGGAIGAPLFGMLGDRIGRKIALQASLVLMAVGSIAAALSPDLTTLTISRGISGFAIGGYLPLVATFLADLLPPRRRGALILVTTAIGCLGGPAVILLLRGLGASPPLGVEGWRWALGAGAPIGILAALAMTLVPESPRWLAAAGRSAEAARACRRFEAAAGRPPRPDAILPEARPVQGGYRALIAEPEALRRTGLLVALYALGTWAVAGFPLLSAAVLIGKGFRVDESLVFAGLTMFGPTLGNLATSFVVDRMGRRACMLACAAAMATMGAIFAESGDLTTLMIVGLVFNMAGTIYGSLLTIYATEILPTAMRGTALSYAWSASRISATLTPIGLLPLLTLYGPYAMFGVMGLTLAVSVIVILRSPPGLSGQSVD